MISWVIWGGWRLEGRDGAVRCQRRLLQWLRGEKTGALGIEGRLQTGGLI